ncbi:MAG: TolC family protein [Thalassotalea sp.]|nr:TolC family protein [Thalassotalea sp.]
MSIKQALPDRKISMSSACFGIAISIICIFSNSVLANTVDSQNSTQILRFEQAIKIAQKNDPWLSGNLHKQNAIESMSHVSNTLPDPKITIGVGNLAADSLDFDQEPMTQFNIGITQMFPRGDSLSIRQQQLREESEQYPLMREDRKAKVASTVGTLWLDAYYIDQSIRLVTQNRKLFEQLIDLTESSYASAKGNTSQQDVIRAEVELSKIDDRIVQLRQQKNRFQGQLSQWLSNYNGNNSEIKESLFNFHNISLDQKLPNIDVLNSNLVFTDTWLPQEQLVNSFVKHPAVLALDRKLKAASTGITLANQKYKPEWGITASYGYRDDDPMGNERSDLMSLGVTFDLPLFTENRQDNEVKAAVSNTEVVKTERILLLRKLMASFNANKGRLQQLEQRFLLFNVRLIPQINEQIEASISAYTSDNGDFSEVIRARVSLLNANVDLLAIQVEKQKILLALNYLFIHDIRGINPLSNDNKNFSESHNEIY